MIYLFTRQSGYFDSLQTGLAAAGFESRIFDDSQTLVSALKGKIADAMLLDLRFEYYPPRYLEKIFLDYPSVIVLGLTGPNSGSFEEYNRPDSRID
jgi:FixJ family two-component response regulator